MLYRYPDLTKRVFALLCKYFLRKRTALDTIENIQVLESQKSTTMLQEIKEIAKDLKNKQSDAQFWMQKLNSAGNKVK